MSISPTYPGVYLQELTSSVHTITGVPTSVAAFVGAAPRGPVTGPVHIGSFADYQRAFGGVSASSPMSYAVYQFYNNGGSDAVVVRITSAGNVAATIDITPEAAADAKITLAAASPGIWGNGLQVTVDHNIYPPPQAGATPSYNLTVYDTGSGTRERYLSVSTASASPQSLDKMLSTSALLATPAAPVPTTVPPAGTYDASGGGNPGAKDTPPADTPPGYADYLGSQADKTGIYQLYNAGIFNLLCLPGAPAQLLTNAATLCVDLRAILLVDPPAAWTTVANAVTGMNAPPLTGAPAANAAVYFPSLQLADPSQNGLLITVPPCGTIAGVIASTDASRGVWKAPAGTAASLVGVTSLVSVTGGLPLNLADSDSGQLNPLGVNCLRSFPVIGPVVWGARTLVGADALTSQWKYLPVRRLALYIESSLLQGTQWVVFEPNDEPLWSAIRLNVGAFMNSLFQQGAFQGQTAQDAYLVKCDQENNPQNTIDQGIVNILVGFAPLDPAEFVIIQIEQLAGQLQT
ncbi:MAG: phage tail sheath C-terminal domain-containing protein [Streptosporangiaceae bacterium]|jgi:phage tail sheath protein FI